MEWPAPTGMRGSVEGIEVSLKALGFVGTVEGKGGEEIVFSARKDNARAGIFLAGLVGIPLAVALQAMGVRIWLIVLALVLIAYWTPRLLLPKLRLDGRIAGGKMTVDLTGGGIFAVPGRIERKIRFYLEG
jgi:hypothetical protein